MATTSIWAVKGWLGQVVIYAEKPEKTANPAYYEKEGMTAAQAQGLSDVIDYAAQSRKTGLTDEHAEIMRHFVTGIHCQTETARNEIAFFFPAMNIHSRCATRLPGRPHRNKHDSASQPARARC